VCVVLSYGAPDVVPLARLLGRIARYARGEDYHLVVKQKLGVLAGRLAQAGVGSRAAVDTAPLLERDLAERAGLGFVGKNTMVIVPGLGSYVVLGELLLDAEAAPTEGDTRKRCGSCRACLDRCPTGAFVDEHVLDARRCISYLTIEHTGEIPVELRPLMGAMVFGCDICQEVCPFNTAVSAGHAEPPAPELTAGREVPELIALLQIGTAQHRKLVRRTALRRVHRAQLQRNAAIALGNLGDAAAVPALTEAAANGHPLVRPHAAWALARIADPNRT
jgi:epoxyqueuosine reductase